VNEQDFDALTEPQRHVLGAIAVNMDSGHHPATLRKLMELGLIEEYEETLGGRFPVRIKRYVVPLPVHIAWCEWCDANYDDDGEPEIA
jgi:hypothetical protein